MSIRYRVVVSALLAWACLLTLILMRQLTPLRPELGLLMTVLVIEVVAFRRYRGTSIPWHADVVTRELLVTIPLGCGVLMAYFCGPLWSQIAMSTALIAAGIAFEIVAFRRVQASGLIASA